MVWIPFSISESRLLFVRVQVDPAHLHRAENIYYCSFILQCAKKYLFKPFQNIKNSEKNAFVGNLWAVYS